MLRFRTTKWVILNDKKFTSTKIYHNTVFWRNSDSFNNFAKGKLNFSPKFAFSTSWRKLVYAEFLELLRCLQLKIGLLHSKIYFLHQKKNIWNFLQISPSYLDICGVRRIVQIARRVIIFSSWKQSKVNQKNPAKSEVANLPSHSAKPAILAAKPANPVQNSPLKRRKTEGELKKEIEDKKRSLKSAIKFFDPSTISSDEEEEEDD